MTLWLVRHARPLIEPGACYGATDVPADPQATAEQARRLAESLPIGVRVLSSPLQRCESLAVEICRLRPDLSYECDARLREMNFGRWEGRRWDAIGADEFDSWMRDFRNHRAGGGESVEALMERVAHALQATCEDNTESTMWITHAGVIRAVQLIASGITQITHPKQWPSVSLAYGACNELLLTRTTSDRSDRD